MLTTLSYLAVLSVASPLPERLINEKPKVVKVSIVVKCKKPDYKEQLARFPGIRVSKSCVKFIDARLDYLQERLEWDSQNKREIGEEISELKELITPWRLLNQAQDGNLSLLKEIKHLIGEDNYDKGYIPSPVIIRRYSSID
jgi:hypothetical protein